MAITPWLQYADHPLAPTCRSPPGSNMPVGDSAGAALTGNPLGGGGAVCRAASTAHTAKVGGGLKTAAAAAPSSVRGEHTLRRALEHSADYAGGKPDNVAAATLRIMSSRYV
jgi:hypothetical protein